MVVSLKVLWEDGSEGDVSLRPRHLLRKQPAEVSPTKTFKPDNAAVVDAGLQSG